MNRKQQRETLLTMLDEELLTELLGKHFPEAIVNKKKHSSIAEKIDLVVDKFNDEEKYAKLLSTIIQMHADRESKE